MNFVDGVRDFATAVGRGVVSVPRDFMLGLDRIGESYGSEGWSRSADIGDENRALARLLVEACKAPTKVDGPLYRSVFHVLSKYYSELPEDVLMDLAARTLVNGGGYGVGRMVIGRKLAQYVVGDLLVRVASTTAFQALATRVGVAAGANASLVGIPIGMTLLMGVAQRASISSQNLSRADPELYNVLYYDGRLDLVFFMVEKHVEKHIASIREAQRARERFEREAERLRRQ